MLKNVNLLKKFQIIMNVTKKDIESSNKSRSLDLKLFKFKKTF